MPNSYYTPNDLPELRQRLAATNDSGWDRFRHAFAKGLPTPLAALLTIGGSPRGSLERTIGDLTEAEKAEWERKNREVTYRNALAKELNLNTDTELDRKRFENDLETATFARNMAKKEEQRKAYEAGQKFGGITTPDEAEQVRTQTGGAVDYLTVADPSSITIPAAAPTRSDYFNPAEAVKALTTGQIIARANDGVAANTADDLSPKVQMPAPPANGYRVLRAAEKSNQDPRLAGLQALSEQFQAQGLSRDAAWEKAIETINRVYGRTGQAAQPQSELDALLAAAEGLEPEDYAEIQQLMVGDEMMKVAPMSPDKALALVKLKRKLTGGAPPQTGNPGFMDVGNGVKYRKLTP